LSRFDEFALSLPRLWVAAALLCLFDCVLLSWTLIGAPGLGALFAWMPRFVGGGILLYGPFIVAALWAVIVTFGITIHRGRALWLLVTALLVLPATYVHWALVWGCAVYGRCL
jgi:hypothetical protein